MLTYSFTDIGSDTLYNHLYKCIKNDILSGSLDAGTRLPSKRSLAKNLGISVITVESAYGQLVAEGYIYALPKKGFFVADIKRAQEKKPHLFSPQRMSAFPQGIRPILPTFQAIRLTAKIFRFPSGRS